jgi:DnaJ-class molecular chaperone
LMRATLPREMKCEACDGTGFPKVKQPPEPGRRIYPAPCRKCGGKGRIKETGN